MSDSDPPIIQGDHPFKVEAVLSKTGGINALSKRPKKMVKGEEIRSDHHEAVPSEAMSTDERVHLDQDLVDDAENDGPLLQDQLDTRHREQFVDPSRRLKTNQRVKIQSSQDTGDTRLQIPPEDKSHLTSATPLDASDEVEPPLQSKEAPASTLMAAPLDETAPTSDASDASDTSGATAAATAEAEAQEQRQQFLRRIEQIKHTNESVGKDLEALEKLTQSRAPLKPAD